MKDGVTLSGSPALICWSIHIQKRRHFPNAASWSIFNKPANWTISGLSGVSWLTLIQAIDIAATGPFLGKLNPSAPL